MSTMDFFREFPSQLSWEKAVEVIRRRRLVSLYSMTCREEKAVRTSEQAVRLAEKMSQDWAGTHGLFVYKYDLKRQSEGRWIQTSLSVVPAKITAVRALVPTIWINGECLSAELLCYCPYLKERQLGHSGIDTQKACEASTSRTSLYVDPEQTIHPLGMYYGFSVDFYMERRSRQKQLVFDFFEERTAG